MPAIKIARLQAQTALLVDQFNQPQVFVRMLHEMLGFYDDPSYKPGILVTDVPNMPHYNLSPQILRHIEAELRPVIPVNRQASLLLANALWESGFLETCSLAGFILGHLPLDPVEDITSQLDAWISSSINKLPITILFQKAAVQLYQQLPDVWTEMIESLLDDQAAWRQSAGLTGIRAAVAYPGFINTPLVFKLISPFFAEVSGRYEKDVQAIIKVLAEKFNSETAYFLKQKLTTIEGQHVARLIRQYAAFFDGDVRQQLMQLSKRTK